MFSEEKYEKYSIFGHFAPVFKRLMLFIFRVSASSHLLFIADYSYLEVDLKMFCGKSDGNILFYGPFTL